VRPPWARNGFDDALGVRIGQPTLHKIAQRFQGEKTEEVFRCHPPWIWKRIETLQPGTQLLVRKPSRMTSGEEKSRLERKSNSPSRILIPNFFSG
jgi:hypothetical protein